MFTQVSQKEDVTFLEYQLTPRGDTVFILRGTIAGPHVIYSSTAKKWWALVAADLGCEKVAHSFGFFWEQRPSPLLLSGFNVINNSHGGVSVRCEG